MKNYKKLYEELRQAIDGGYSLATHEDALESVRSTQRTWVGLTEDEVNDLYNEGMGIHATIEATEAKLKEKNT